MRETTKKGRKYLDNINSTAYKIISIFNMLLERPCSDKEINEKLLQDIVRDKSFSQDTICIYINTLREIGCSISRPSKSNGYKYILKSHPFKLELSDEEIDFLVEIKKIISVSENWKLILNIDTLIHDIQENLQAEQKKKFAQKQKDSLRSLEISKQIQLINLLEQYCSKKRALVVGYDSLDTGNKDIEITVDKLIYEGGALYLLGTNTENDETLCLRVDRITNVKTVNLRANKTESKVTKIHYQLKGLSALTYSPDHDEIVIEKKDKEVIIEVKTKSKFKIMQRILSYGSDCIVLSPDSFKNEVIAKFKSTLSTYQ